MKQLIVFIGKPGVGKSTLISQLFTKTIVVDVLPFVKQYENEGTVSDANTVRAYQDMYKHINDSDFDADVILELGTNHPDLNVGELLKFVEDFSLKVFLCDAPTHVCRERAMKRGREFDAAALESRLSRDFPNSHLSLFREAGVPYHVLDMEKPLLDSVRTVREMCRLE